MKSRLIVLSLAILSLTACNLENIKDSKVDKLAAEKNVTELVNQYVNKEPGFGTAQAVEALGNLGDQKAVDPLIKAFQTPLPSSPSRDAIKTRAAIAIALGKLKDTKAIKPLIATVNHSNPKIAQASQEGLKTLATTHSEKILAELMPQLERRTEGNDSTQEKALTALGVVGHPALDRIITLLNSEADEDWSVRINAARVLGDLKDPKAIAPLKKHLTDPVTGPMAGIALTRLNWQPTTDVDKVHFLAIQKKGAELRKMWSTAQAILLKDLATSDRGTVLFAMNTLIGVGDQETQAAMLKTLKAQGTETMALAFLNCGEPTLSKAAEDWAAERGLRVVQTTERKNSNVKWGSF